MLEHEYRGAGWAKQYITRPNGHSEACNFIRLTMQQTENSGGFVPERCSIDAEIAYHKRMIDLCDHPWHHIRVNGLPWTCEQEFRERLR